MWEMIERAWNGWQNYTDNGKLAALAMAVVVYLFWASKVKGPKARFVIYAGIMILVCICPVTAVVLMKYQTAFYDYQWIWSMVPVTALIALGGTVFLIEQWRPGKGWRSLGYNAILTLASVLLLFLCGGLGKGSVDIVQADKDRSHGEAVLEQVKQQCGGDVCLWAPADILQYARLEGDMELLYGRNMWDIALNAYSYDTYSAEEEELYQWMERLDDWAIEISVNEVDEYVLRGFEAGAEVILLPTELSDWLVEPESEALLLECLGAYEGREVLVLEEYYLLKQ